MFQLTSNIFEEEKIINKKKHDWLRSPDLTVAKAADVISSGYEVNGRAAKHQTALHVLLRYCSAPFELVDLVRLLLEHGADVNAVDDSHHTALTWCVLHMNHGLKFHVHKDAVPAQPWQHLITIQDAESKDLEQVQLDSRFQEQLHIVLRTLLEAGASPHVVPRAVPKHMLGVTRIDAYGYRVFFQENRWRQLNLHLYRMGVERTMYDAFNPMNNHFTTESGINLIHMAAWRGDAQCLEQLIKHACIHCARAVSDMNKQCESDRLHSSQGVTCNPRKLSDIYSCIKPKSGCSASDCAVRAVTGEDHNALHYLYCYCNKPADLVSCTRLLLCCGLSCHLEDRAANDTPILLLVRNVLTKLSFIRHMANTFTEETISKSDTMDHFHSVICECFHVMTDFGVDISRPNGVGLNPLSELFQYFSHDAVVGFNMDVQQHNIDIVPFIFDMKSFLAVVEVLLAYGCDINARYSDGRSRVIADMARSLDLLYLGPEMNSPADLCEVMELLLQKGADNNRYQQPAYLIPITQMVTTLSRRFSRQLDKLEAYLSIVDVYAAHRPHWSSGLLLDVVLPSFMAAPFKARHMLLSHLISLGFEPCIGKGATIAGNFEDIPIFRLLHSYGDASITKCFIKMHSDHRLDMLAEPPPSDFKASTHALMCHLCTTILELHQVKTLAFQCKKTIWKKLGNQFRSHVQFLPLPSRIREYLLNIDCI